MLHRKSPQTFHSQAPQRVTPNPTTGILRPPPSQRGKSTPTTPISFRRITNQEARERREKGLCYYCDENLFLAIVVNAPTLHD